MRAIAFLLVGAFWFVALCRPKPQWPAIVVAFGVLLVAAVIVFGI